MAALFCLRADPNGEGSLIKLRFPSSSSPSRVNRREAVVVFGRTRRRFCETGVRSVFQACIQRAFIITRWPCFCFASIFRSPSHPGCAGMEPTRRDLVEAPLPSSSAASRFGPGPSLIKRCSSTAANVFQGLCVCIIGSSWGGIFLFFFFFGPLTSY